ncbi:MAG TPA: RNA methyltransferase [Terracidiphilus sp.]|jgi:TrmH family RNA methyltransferase
MPVRIVQSKQNTRLKELRRALAHPGRDTHGLAGIEGPHLLEEALKAGLHVSCVFVRQDQRQMAEHLPIAKDTDVLIVPRLLLDAALQTETPQSVAALVEMPDWTWSHVLRGRAAWDPLVLVLAGVQDPGNLGAIVRSAEAFGASGILALPGTVSIWNPKAVRASAGSIFRLPVLSIGLKECVSNLRESSMRILTTTARGAEPADMVNFTGPLAIVIGNEANGVPDEIAEQADTRVTIPCPGPVESLNAAVAASVLLYEACRQRECSAGGPHPLRGTGR